MPGAADLLFAQVLRQRLSTVRQSPTRPPDGLARAVVPAALPRQRERAATGDSSSPAAIQHASSSGFVFVPEHGHARVGVGVVFVPLTRPRVMVGNWRRWTASGGALHLQGWKSLTLKSSMLLMWPSRRAAPTKVEARLGYAQPASAPSSAQPVSQWRSKRNLAVNARSSSAAPLAGHVTVTSSAPASAAGGRQRAGTAAGLDHAPFGPALGRRSMARNAASRWRSFKTTNHYYWQVASRPRAFVQLNQPAVPAHTTNNNQQAPFSSLAILSSGD